MRVRVPIIIAFVMGVAMFVQFFVPHPISQAFADEMETWTRLIAGFALALGIGSLIQTHLLKIRRRPAEAPYSVVALVCLVAMAVLGIILGQEHGPAKWLFDNVLTPLNGTMFALLAFFVASAAYRTFRVRSFEATLLLSVALVVMLGRVLITAYIHPHLPD